MRTGESGPFLVTDTAIDWWYSNDGPNVWVRNVSAAYAVGLTCPDLGDSGGSVFSIVTGGVKAMGTYSGYRVQKCSILFTDIYRSYQGLPGDVLLNP